MKDQPQKEEVLFDVSGSFHIPADATAITDYRGHIIGYRLKDGTQVKLAVCLEITKDEKTYRYVTKTAAMERLGFRGLDYTTAEFQPI